MTITEADLASAGLVPVEIAHALDNLETVYPDEAVVQTQTGRSIRCPAFPAPCDYVRITTMVRQCPVEVAYWHKTEWAAAPAEIMGALLGCAMTP